MKFLRFASAENSETLAQADFDWEPLVTIAGTGAVTALIALLSAWLGWRTARHTERRKLYAEATKAAVAWAELVYRVRRRGSNDPDVVRPLVQRFHEAQEQITFHEAWIGSESEQMAASYKKLVSDIKKETLPLINEAWKEAPRALPGNAEPEDKHPMNVAASTDAFLSDVRSHLSLNPFKKHQGGKNDSDV